MTATAPPTPTPERRALPAQGVPPAHAAATLGALEAHGTHASPKTQTQQLRQRWLRECGVIALSYVLNGALISLLALTGTVPWWAGLLYAGPGLVATGVIANLIAIGATAGFKDASLSSVHPSVSVVLCLVGLALMPQLVFAYGLILFVVFLTATYRTPILHIVVTVILTCLAVGGLTVGLGRSLQIPHASWGEQFIAWLFFWVTLGRCAMLSVINAGGNRALRGQGQKMTLALAEIERLAHHDELTRVLNRRRLMQLLAEEMLRSERTGSPLSVALLDLDHFKAINDSLGHPAGDQVLAQFAAAVQAQARTTDRFGRYGGEEFLIILTEADGPQAHRAVERMRAAMAPTDWSHIAPNLRVTFSAGLSTYRVGDTAEALLHRADQGLYVAKNEGRNCTRFHPDEQTDVPASAFGAFTAPAPLPISPSANVNDTAATAEPKAQNKTRRLLKNLKIIALSYLVDGLMLSLFHLTGTIGWAPVLIYTGCGLAACLLLATLISSGWTQRLKDPGIFAITSITNTTVQLVALYLWPEVGFMFVLILFIVYSALSLQLPVRKTLIAWCLVGLGTALAFSLNDARLRIPDSNLAEQLLAGAFFTLTLLRCVSLGSYNKSMTALLKKRGKELAVLTAKVEHLAHHDELTGLLNRRSLITALREEQARADRYKTPLCVGMIDIDKFKTINDTLGHVAGDKTLKIFAQTLKQNTRRTNHLGRYGGEEFVVILIDTPADVALRPLDRVHEAMKTAEWSDISRELSITFSCGLACYQPGEPLEDLIQRADVALYRAKADGRNCTRVG